MSKKDDSPSTAVRVKAFRDRLSSSSYKRVEGYVTADEKARVDAVKAQLGVTTDVAVAGLLRMGLEQYEKTLTTPVPDVLFTAEMETCSAQAPVVTQGLGMLGGDMAYLNGMSGDLRSLTSNSVSAFAISANACAQNAAPVGLDATYSVSATQDNDNNPIARFFKHRKEMNNA
jgi:hypothetical protein